MPDNFATLDHLHTRYFPAIRRAANPEVQGHPITTTVLACHKCNQARGEQETRSLPREVLWEKSGAYPQGHEKAVDRREVKEV